jgi:hypothetical protein
LKIHWVLAAMAIASPGLAAMPSGWIYTSRAVTSQPASGITVRCSDGSWIVERERDRACPRQGGVASWRGQRAGLLARTAEDTSRAVR